MKRASLILLPLLLSASLHAEPFTLARPQVGPPQYAPYGVTLGGGPEGFLLAGTSSHRPVAIPLATDAMPQITHTVELGLPSASSVGTPLWIGDRWVVAVIPDHNLPDRLVITELDETALPIGDPHAIEWERFRLGDLASNSRAILAAGLTGRTTTILRDLSVRVIGPDLQTASTPIQIATEVTGMAVSGAQEGFHIAWTGSDGAWIQALDDSGTPLSAPVELSVADDIRNLGIAVSGEHSMVVWTEPAESGWQIRAAHATTSGSSLTPMTLDIVDGSNFQVALVTAREHGFTFSWQPVDYEQGRRLGREVLVQRTDQTGTALEDPWTLPNLIGEELLTASASRGDEVLLAYSRHFVSVGTPIWGTIIRDDGTATVPTYLSIAPASLRELRMSSAGDGTSWGTWIEMTGAGTSMHVARWNASGEKIIQGHLIDLPEWIRSADIATNGSDTMIAWHQGHAIFAAPLTDDGIFARDPFYVAIGDNPNVPSTPRIEWDGSRFVIGWLDNDGIRVAHAIPEGVQRNLGTVATAPRSIPNERTFGISSFEMAAVKGMLAIAADVIERPFCVGIPCQGQRDFAGWLVSNREASEELTIIGKGDQTDIAWNGDRFMLAWRDTDGINVMPVDAGGVRGSPRLAFRWPGAGAPAIVADGDRFLVGLPYATSSWMRMGLLTIAGRGDSIDAPRSIPTWNRHANHTLQLVDRGSDQLLAWIGPYSADESSSSVVGAFAREFVDNPPPPATPSGIRMTRTANEHSIILSWDPVPGAVEYQIEYPMLNNYGDDFTWYRLMTTTETSV